MITLDYLYQIAGNDSTILNELFSTLRKNLLELPPEIQLAAQQQQWEQLRNAAHKLKSCVAYIGASELHQILVEIEHNSSNSFSPIELEEKVKQVNDWANQILAELNKISRYSTE
ncbi:MAG: Hpt domain-containing protein [Cytophagales bacterium]|nr:Hpt domain-containing protein [Bernardetiaceae bacterium]MDW8209972.1 Hpt domain-containing protein [Cytophagales bacterium]